MQYSLISPRYRRNLHIRSSQFESPDREFTSSESSILQTRDNDQKLRDCRNLPKTSCQPRRNLHSIPQNVVYSPPQTTTSGHGRTPRQEVGSIGWGLNLQEHTSSLAHRNIPKPSVRYWDQKLQNSFINTTGVRGAESDQKLGVDHKIFSMMNHQAQRVAVKSLSLLQT